MANIPQKKIANLDPIVDTSLTNADVLPIVSAGVTWKVSIADLALKFGRLFLPAGIAISFANWISNNRVFNVKDYGAVGNNVTNDTVPIQAAMTAAVAQGGVVVFPPSSGKYYINTNTTFAYGVIIRSTGGIIDVDVTKTLTLNSSLPQEHIPLFTPTSPIIFSDSNTMEVYAGWWGASPNATAVVNKLAIVASLNIHNRATRVWLPRGQLQVDGGIDFTKAGVLLSGAAPSGWWAGYGIGGTVLDVTSGTYAFSLLGTQPFPVGGNVTDGSGIENMTIQSSTQYGVATGIKFTGPKTFRNLQIRRFSTYGIQCQDYGIQFEIDNVFLFDIGPLVAQSGKAIQITGSSTTIYRMQRIYISNCYVGVEIKAGLNAVMRDSTIETCTKEALLLTNITGQSMVDLRFENIWLEGNATGTYAIKLDTAGASASWYASGTKFVNCRPAGTSAGQRSVYIGANATLTVMETCRLGGNATDTATFNSPVTLIDPVGPYYLDATSQANVMYSTAAASIVQSPAGWFVNSAGALPQGITFPDATTITLTMKANAAGALLLTDAGSGNIALIAFGPGTALVLIVVDGIGAVTATSTPAAGKFGIWKPTNASLSIKNAIGGSRTITLHTLGVEVLSMTNPV